MSGSKEESDAELLRLMLEGDESAFTALYRRRQGGVYRFALQMSGSEALAEDVVQETFMVLIREGRNFDPARGSVAAYLYGIARNHVLRAFERERALVRFEEETEGEDAPHENLVARPDPLGDLTRGEMFERLRLAVLALPPHYREALVLCELEDELWSYAGPVTAWTNAWLQPPPEHILDVLAAATAHEPVADALAQGFADPVRFAADLATPEAAAAFTRLNLEPAV